MSPCKQARMEVDMPNWQVAGTLQWHFQTACCRKIFIGGIKVVVSLNRGPPQTPKY